MAKQILIIDGHPDPGDARFVHALADAYAEAATTAGHEVRKVRIAALKFALLPGNEDYLHGRSPPVIKAVQDDIAWCNHMVILFPLWLGDMPALLKGLFEQALRPGFAYQAATARGLPKQLLKGKSARIVVTMGMPAFFSRWYFRAHSLKNLERNILRFVGIAPIRASIIGSVEGIGAKKRAGWIDAMRNFGSDAK